MSAIVKAFNALLSMVLIAAAAMSAGAAMMLAVLFLVGLVDWTVGQQVASRVNDRGTVEDATDLR